MAQSQQPTLGLRHPTKYHLQQQQQLQQQLQQQQQLSFSEGMTMEKTQQPSSHAPGHFFGSPSSDQLDFNEAFLSPMSTVAPLDDMDDLDYQTGLTIQRRTAQPLHDSSQFIDGGWYNSPPQGYSYPLNVSDASPSSISRMPQSPQSLTMQSSMQHLALSAPATIDHFHAPFGASPPTFVSQQSFDYSAPNGPAMAKSLEEDYAVQLNLQRLTEKRRLRRESHNLVERRRRDNINERINELGLLLPEGMLDTTGPHKPNKGSILIKSVEHIQQLKQQVGAYQQRIRELEEALETYRKQQQQPSHKNP